MNKRDAVDPSNLRNLTVARPVTPPARPPEFARDVQRRIYELETALERSQRDQSHLAAEVAAFTAALSHDLRAPLRTMVGFGEILQADFAEALPGDAMSYVGRMVRAARKMDTLIERLLAYSRIGTTEFEFECVDLDDLVFAALHANETLQQHRVAFRTLCPLGHVRGSRSILQQVLPELFANAVRFRREEVPLVVIVRSEQRDSQVRLWIEDNGIGVPSTHRDKIWQMFERLDPVRCGTGAGLAIVRRGVNRLDGACGVESDGPGARFWIELAAVQA